jgi:MoaA/NifB/PqqE/SkfB family radical SAM enzyme
VARVPEVTCRLSAALVEACERLDSSLQSQQTGVVRLDLVNRCNHACSYCAAHSPDLPRRDEAWLAQRLAPERLPALLAGAGSVVFGGPGEPLLHPEIEAMIAAVKARGLHLTLRTNLLACRSVERLCRSGVDLLAVSVSAGTEAGWRRVHPFQHADDFPRLLAMLRQIAESSGPAVELGYVVHSENYDEVEEAVRLAAQVGARACRFRSFVPVSGLEHLRLNARQRQVFERGAQRARELAHRVKIEIAFE